MPESLPNPWYSTPNIHLCTVEDFEKLCDERGIHIIERIMVNDDYRRTSTGNLMPNLLGRTAIYRFRHQ